MTTARATHIASLTGRMLRSVDYPRGQIRVIGVPIFF